MAHETGVYSTCVFTGASLLRGREWSPTDRSVLADADVWQAATQDSCARHDVERRVVEVTASLIDQGIGQYSQCVFVVGDTTEPSPDTPSSTSDLPDGKEWVGTDSVELPEADVWQGAGGDNYGRHDIGRRIFRVTCTVIESTTGPMIVSGQVVAFYGYVSNESGAERYVHFSAVVESVVARVPKNKQCETTIEIRSNGLIEWVVNGGGPAAIVAGATGTFTGTYRTGKTISFPGTIREVVFRCPKNKQNETQVIIESNGTLSFVPTPAS